MFDIKPFNMIWLPWFVQVLDGALPPTADPFSSTTFIKVAIDQFGQAPIFTVGPSWIASSWLLRSSCILREIGEHAVYGRCEICLQWAFYDWLEFSFLYTHSCMHLSFFYFALSRFPFIFPTSPLNSFSGTHFRVLRSDWRQRLSIREATNKRRALSGFSTRLIFQCCLNLPRFLLILYIAYHALFLIA